MSIYCLDSDPDCKTDAAVSVLSQVYGYDFIHGFIAAGGTPSEAAATSLGPVIFGGIAIVGGMLAFVLLISLTFTTLLNSAQDGEAFGKGSTKVVILARFLFGVVMLFPTGSGYCIAQIVLMGFILWSNGETNQLYNNVVMKSTIKDVSTQTSPDLAASVDAYGVRGFALAHFQQAYCLNLLNANYSGSGGTQAQSVTSVNNAAYSSGGFISSAYVPSANSNVFGPIDSGLLNINGNDKKEAGQYRAIKLVDKNGSIALPNVPVCGSLKITYPVANGTSSYDKEVLAKGGLGLSIEEQTDIYKAIADGSAEIANNKAAVLLQTTAEVSDWINTANIPYDLNDPTYVDQLSSVDFRGLRTTIKTMQDKGNMDFQALVKRLDLQSLIQRLTDALTAKGWTHAAGIKQRILSVQSGFIHSLGTSVVSITAPDLSTLKNDDERIEKFKAAVKAMNLVVSTTIGSPEYASASDQETIAQIIPSSFDEDTSAKSINESLNDSYSTFISRFKKQVVYLLITGNFNENSPEAVLSTGLKTDWLNNEDDVLTHIQLTGELMSVFNSQMLGMFMVAQTTANAAYAASPPIVDKIPQAVIFELQYVFRPLLEKALFYIGILDTYMAVVIPSMPYFFFITGVVAWYIHTLQAMAGLPFWAVMHMIPERSFVGSQTQGYVTVISLFLRPMLTLAGLFLAFILADPILIFVTDTFFAMQDNMLSNSVGTGFWRIIIELVTFSKWLIVYCTLIMSICFMIFGLAGTLPDTVLRWLGSGLQAGGWGESNARDALAGGAKSGVNDNAVGKDKQQTTSNNNNNGGGAGGAGGGGGTGGGGTGGGGAGGSSTIMTPTSGGVAESFAARQDAKNTQTTESPLKSSSEEKASESDKTQPSSRRFEAMGGMVNSEGKAMNFAELNKVNRENRTSESRSGFYSQAALGYLVGGAVGAVSNIRGGFKAMKSGASEGASAGLNATAQRHFAVNGGVIGRDGKASVGNKNISGAQFTSEFNKLNKANKDG